jgi:hypothetical protein
MRYDARMQKLHRYFTASHDHADYLAQMQDALRHLDESRRALYDIAPLRSQALTEIDDLSRELLARL